MLTVSDSAPCEYRFADDEDTWPCGELSRFLVERADGNPAYVPAECCAEHVSTFLLELTDGDTDTQLIVTIRWDADEAPGVTR